MVAVVLIASFVTGPLQANCYLLAAGDGADCVIVDPGMEAMEMLVAGVAKYRLRPVAVALTHGHIDHVGSAREAGRTYDVPVYCPAADRILLSEPMEGLADFGEPLLIQYYGGTHLAEPEEVVDVAPGSHHLLAGFDLEFLHAPGHTPGCSMIRLVDDEHGPVVMSGDVVFAGSIGRTDMPGGDPGAMRTSLEQVVWPLADSSHLLPGHGRATIMAAERATNPFLHAPA